MDILRARLRRIFELLNEGLVWMMRHDKWDRTWFAWRPVRLSRYNKEPDEADPLVKALCNGWQDAGKWAWFARVRRIRNFVGDVFYEALPEITLHERH